jgi:hypothetical protein
MNGDRVRPSRRLVGISRIPVSAKLAPHYLSQRLYDSEINFEVSGFYDAGFDVRFGDHLNGFLVKDKVETWAEAETWLREQALAHFPDSKFAQDELRAAQAHWPRTVSCLYGIGPTGIFFARDTERRPAREVAFTSSLCPLPNP